MEVQAQSRKLLPNTLLYNLPPSPTYPASGPIQSDTVRYQAKTSSFNSLNESIVLVLSILFCSLICVLVINAIVRCVLRIMSPTCYHREPPGPLGRPTKTARAARKDALRALPARVYTAGLGSPGLGRRSARYACRSSCTGSTCGCCPRATTGSTCGASTGGSRLGPRAPRAETASSVRASPLPLRPGRISISSRSFRIVQL
uniref:Uncharacterized protein n=1 Tax=Ananas comosus var. bracteatus TaxID=296719 RepID=A0A6V7NHV3_ANACO|nr:unnamed protein product [Ananas comosus var. bracteatus]